MNLPLKALLTCQVSLRFSNSFIMPSNKFR
jgi:hypothetical protein